MTVSNLRTMMAAALLGTGLMSLTTASAEEPGVVRISDGITQTAALADGVSPPAPLPAEVTGDDVNTAVSSNSMIQPVPEGAIIHHGHSRYCPPGHGHSGYHHGCRYGKNALPADYGFHPPTPYPYIWRQPVVYQRYLPDQLYGTPGMRYTEAAQPMVYMPTDTTQLGFNYMLAPQWMPNRANYPRVPNPVMWQRRAAPYPAGWEDPTRVKHKHFHLGKNKDDLKPSVPIEPPNHSNPVEPPEPAPAKEASLEIDAEI